MPFLSIQKKQVLGQVLKAGMNTLSYLAPPLAGRLALEVFTAPQKGRYKDKTAIPAGLQEAKAGWMQAVGLPIRTWRWSGVGKRILLAHGWESNSLRWVPWLEMLQESGYEIIAIDAPAHGNSGGNRFSAVLYAEVLKEAVKQFEPEVLVGHSAGGIAGVYLHSHLGESKLKKLIILAVPSELSELTRIYQQLLGFNDRVMDALDRQFIARYGSSIGTFSVKEFAKKLQLPGLIVHDKTDVIAPYQAMIETHENWRGSRLFLTEGLGHSLASRKVIEVVREEIDRE